MQNLFLFLKASLSACAITAIASTLVLPGCNEPHAGVACTESEPCDRFDTGAGTVPYFRNKSILTSDAAVTTAIIVIHGANLKADFSYENMSSVVASEGALDQTLIVAPYFQAADGVDCDDATSSPIQSDLVWSCSGWKYGAAAQNAALTSYDVIDQMVETIAAPNRFPNLQRIVIAGHSAGGQFTIRYAAFTKTPSADKLHYVIANPSSYPYLDAARANGDSSCTTDGCEGGFGPYQSASACPTFDQFPYGLESPFGYATTRTADAADAIKSRNIAFLAGDEDVLANAKGTDMDESCNANAQGIDRKTRALNYFNYLHDLHHSTSTLSIVPACKHSESCMFNSNEAKTALFEQ